MGIYAIQIGEGAIKIGFTRRDPRIRLAAIQSSHHAKVRLVGFLEEGTYRQEQRLHARFKAARIRGEWFNPTLAVIKFVSGMGVPVFPPMRGKSPNSRLNKTLDRARARRMNKASIAARTKDRMPDTEAKVIWQDRKKYRHWKQAIRLMRGWTRPTAYNQLGKRGVPSGRSQIEA